MSDEFPDPVEITGFSFPHQAQVFWRTCGTVMALRRAILRATRRTAPVQVTTNRLLSTPPHRPFRIPKPTWSVRSLELEKDHPPAENLDLLAKRAGLCLAHFSAEEQERFRQDVGNMLSMMRQVSSREKFSEDPAVLYDQPRNVVKTPVRKDEVTDNTHQEVTNRMKETLFERRLKRHGAHVYFECTGGRSSDSSSKA